MRCVREVMGMPVTVDVPEPGVGDPVVEEVYADLRMVDRLFSPFLPDSAVSKINRGELRPEDAGELVRVVLELCERYERATDGYFTAWNGDRIDPSGLVKGWAIDRACSILDRRAFANYLVDAGGDVMARGTSGAGAPWRVGIRHPVERTKVARVVLARDLAVATSGTYEKGQHVRDPHTGRSATDVVSLTVVGPDILEADVYATAALAMGRRGLAFIERLARFEGYAIFPDLRAGWTSGFPALCA